MESYKTPAQGCRMPKLLMHNNDNTRAITKIAQFFYGNRRDMRLSVFYKTE